MKNKKKCITILTHAPQGTLGDPALCAELVRGLLSLDTQGLLTLKVYIIEGEVLQSKWKIIDSLFPNDSRVSLYFLGKGVPINFQTNDPLVVYPTCNFLKDEDKRFVDRQSKERPCIYISLPNFQRPEQYNKTESERAYDLGLTTIPPYQRRDYQTLKEIDAEGRIIWTGLGEGKAGINISSEIIHPMTIAPEDNDIIAELIGAAFQDFSADFKPVRHLYFGYMNILPAEASKNQGHFKRFIRLCTLKSLKTDQPSVISIVIPFDVQAAKIDDSMTAAYEALQDLGVRVELMTRKAENLTQVMCKGEGEVTVRVINAFPLTKPSIELLYRLSDELSIVTGSSSLAEAIGHNKLFLYQIMNWHTELDSALVGLVNQDSLFAPTHPYREWHRIIRSQDISEVEIMQFYLDNQQALCQGADEFRQHISSHYNLNRNLPGRLIEAIAKQEKKIPSTVIHKPINPQNELKLQLVGMESPSLFYRSLDDFLVTYPKILHEALIEACIKQDYEACNHLLEMGADPNYKMNWGLFMISPGKIAWRLTDIKLLELLLNAPIKLVLSKTIKLLSQGAFLVPENNKSGYASDDDENTTFIERQVQMAPLQNLADFVPGLNLGDDVKYLKFLERFCHACVEQDISPERLVSPIDNKLPKYFFSEFTVAQRILLSLVDSKRIILLNLLFLNKVIPIQTAIDFHEYLRSAKITFTSQIEDANKLLGNHLSIYSSILEELLSHSPSTNDTHSFFSPTPKQSSTAPKLSHRIGK